MTSPRLETVERAIGAWNRGTHAAELFSPDAEFDLTRWAFDVPTVWRPGEPEGRERIESFVSVWEDFRCQTRRLAESKTAVLALVDLQARGRVSRAVVHEQFWLVFEFEGDRIARFSVYPDADEAHIAAGIT